MDGSGNALVTGNLTVLGTSTLAGPVLAQSITAASVATTGAISSGGNLTVGSPAANANLVVNGAFQTKAATVGTVGGPLEESLFAVNGITNSNGVLIQGSGTTATTVTTVTAITFPAGGSTIPLPGVPAQIAFGSCVKVTLFCSTNPNIFGATYNVWVTTVRSAIGGVPIVEAVLLAGNSDGAVSVLNNPYPLSMGGPSFVISAPSLPAAFTATCIVEYTKSSVP
jgi:hypothetical protein